jgi:hypothetical protein
MSLGDGMLRHTDWLAPLVRWQSWLTAGGNLLPLLGIFYLDWDATTLIILYWMETAVVGIWLVIRLGLADETTLPRSQLRSSGTTELDGPALGVFLLLHGGFFMFIHMFFLTGIAPGEWSRHLASPHAFIFGFVIPAGLWIPLAGLFAVRGALTLNEIRSNRHAGHLVAGFYMRIIVMQLVIIMGGMLALLLGNPVVLLVLIVVLKTIGEVYWDSVGPQVAAILDTSRKQPD